MAEGQDNYVGLNVGGKIFKTSRTTLLADPDSFFSGLLDGDIPSARDDHGNILIDQDGEVFRHVLNFMRYNELVLPEGFKEYGALKRQADFFQLESLKSSIERPMQVDGSEAVGLVCPDGKVFHTTREILMRGENSYFTRMLSKDSTVARDLQGNYYLKGISSELLQQAISFLTHGGILTPIDDFSLLNKYDSFEPTEITNTFQLKGFDSHLALLYYTTRNPRSVLTLLVMYYNINTPCFAYFLRAEILDTTVSDSISMLREMLVHNKVRIIRTNYGCVDAGVVNMEIFNSNQPASLEDVIAFFKEYEQLDISTSQSGSNCIIIRIKYVKGR